VSDPPIPISPPSPPPRGALVLETRCARVPLALIAVTAAATAVLLPGLEATPSARLVVIAAVLLVAAAAAASIGLPSPGDRLELDADGAARLVLRGRCIEAQIRIAIAIGNQAWWLGFDTASGRRWIWVAAGSLNTESWRGLCRILLQRRRVDANC
jgi:hypothetical protein